MEDRTKQPGSEHGATLGVKEPGEPGKESGNCVIARLLEEGKALLARSSHVAD